MSEPSQNADSQNATEAESAPESKVESLLMAKELRDAQAVIQQQAVQIKEMQAKLNDFDIRFLEARGFVKKLESEVEQIRLRSERDSQKVIDQKISSFVLKLIPILDLFELSLRSVSDESSSQQSFINGIRLIENEMRSALASVGIERMSTAGVVFDPNHHEALTTQTVPDAALDGKVISEVKAGYLLSGKVIRPAQVIVGQALEASP